MLEKDEQLIKRLFEGGTTEYCEEGIYRLSLYIAGRWRTVTIDDYIPCLPFGTPFFAEIQGSNSIWLSIIEKAFAKIFGGYKYLDGGSAIEALRMLTGAPLTSFNFSDMAVKEMIQQGHFELLLTDFLNKRSFVLVASAAPMSLFCREQDTNL